LQSRTKVQAILLETKNKIPLIAAKIEEVLTYHFGRATSTETRHKINQTKIDALTQLDLIAASIDRFLSKDVHLC
jgi:hypothetical protein